MVVQVPLALGDEVTVRKDGRPGLITGIMLLASGARSYQVHLGMDEDGDEALAWMPAMLLEIDPARPRRMTRIEVPAGWDEAAENSAGQ